MVSGVQLEGDGNATRNVRVAGGNPGHGGGQGWSQNENLGEGK